MAVQDSRPSSGHYSEYDASAAASSAAAAAAAAAGASTPRPRSPTVERFDAIRRKAKRLTMLGGGGGGGGRTKTYDDQEVRDDLGTYAAPNGIRVWYDSYTTIDWIHDSIKESSRLRRIRSIKGIRGLVLNAWDRFQGWLIVTITGILTALIAGAIVESEAVLFDLKDGYCTKSWRLAKRFCCPYGGDQDWDRDPGALSLSSNSSMAPWGWNNAALGKSGSNDPTKGFLTGGLGLGNNLLAGWAAPVAGSPRWDALVRHGPKPGTASENCPGWIRWSEVLSSAGQDLWWADYAVYVFVAIVWASIASILTLYLTSSELYISRKGSEAYTRSVPPTAKTNALRRDDHAIDETTALLASTHAQNAPAPAPSSALPAKFSEQAGIPATSTPRKVLYFGSGSGISEVKSILSGFVIHGYLGFWTLFTKSVGLTLSVASGLSLGKEGPFVHIASCVGNIVCRLADKYDRNESKRREIISCACAAGVAVAFGAPVGGVLFSLEEVSYYFPAKVMFRSFFCAMVAAAGLRFIDPFGTGKIVLFQVSYGKDWAFQELPFFILIGLFGGVYGAYFTRLNMIWSKHVRAKTWMASKPLLEVMMITGLTVAVSFLNGYTRMGGPELITDLFSECHEHESLDGLCISHPSEIRPLVSAIAWAMVAKGLLTIVTFGIKLPAGIFIPSLAVGACFGRIVGLIVQYVQWTQSDLKFFSWCSASDGSCIVPGIYAMVGAAATLSGVTRTTISLAVIMFELTGTLTYSIPVMISVLVARTVADAIQHKGIYDLVIDFSGLPYLDAKASFTWQGVSVKDAMDTGIEYISLDQKNTVASLQNKVERLSLGLGYTDGGFPIVVQSRSYDPAEPSGASATASASASTSTGLRMIGYIAAQELEHGLARLMQARPEIDPLEAECTFAYLPHHTGDEDAADEPNIADSLFLSKNEPQDLSRYVDKAPITVNTYSPLELVQSYFVRLGVRYLVVLDAQGYLKGVIFKKRWLAFLSSLEEGEGEAH